MLGLWCTSPARAKGHNLQALAATKETQLQGIGSWLLSLRSFQRDISDSKPPTVTQQMLLASREEPLRLAETVLNVGQLGEILQLGEAIETRQPTVPVTNDVGALGRAVEARIQLLGWVEELVSDNVIVDEDHFSSMLSAAAGVPPAQYQPESTSGNEGSTAN